MQTEQNNLRIFKILFIIKGIFTCLIALIPAIYICIGAFILHNGQNEGDEMLVGALFTGIGLLIFSFLIIMGVLTILAGIYLGQQRKYTFILVIAILNCLTGILGILLGIFTIIELNKPKVRELFGKT
ncbi:hypothetical protein [Christiangramia salexigens]|uniref:DUF4064 domain-containing protein n=1 Tax=Christiangramia salexigens TaxID=1913577 RepID=A0A1L3J1Z2_9FLAO|nr:hypothetical protein [Christiangramia salexigens]APG59136.1 hypothetical protein LPB144_01375 [Christiangramia salexigens]